MSGSGRTRPSVVPRRIVEFVDTSVLVEILNIPRKAERPDEVRGELIDRINRGCDLILPTAAVIETGNHVHHIDEGTQRRACAELFAVMLEESVNGTAPWVLHDATWDAGLLERIRTGCGTGTDLLGHAQGGDRVGLGAGDLSVLAERDLYREKRVDPRSVEVRVWSTDRLLATYADL